jgi:hypothetical protein
MLHVSSIYHKESRTMSVCFKRISPLMIVLVLITTWVTPSQAQQPNDDRGLEAVRAANLGVFPNQSQTIGDTTVTLNWVYADAHRIALNYEVANGSTPGMMYRSRFHLTDSADSFYMARNGGGSGFINARGNAEYTYSFGAGFYSPTTKQFMLRVEIALEPDNGGFGGGSGFGTGVAIPGQTPAPGIFVDNGVQNSAVPFVFEVSVPVLPAVQIEPNQSVESNGIPLVLTSLSVTPTTTVVVVCNSATQGIRWRPVAQLTTNGITAFTMSSVELPLLSGQGCTDLAFSAPQSRMLTLEVAELIGASADRVSFTSQSAEFFQQYLAERGVEVAINGINQWGDLDYTILSQPDGDVGLILQEAWEQALFERREGHWIFSVSLP